MRGLFRAFEREDVDFLLIGGQAAILYGAAQFTQDLDVWIRPEAGNLKAFLRALGRVGARVHKLTPPFTLPWIRRGHGFHFVIPHPGRLPAYLDAMGRPPRVGSFATAARRARSMETPWGRIPVVSIEDLIELKKTNRPGDYEVISRLVRIRLGEAAAPTPARLAWAIRNTFRIEDLVAILATFGDRMPSRIPGVERPISVLQDLHRAGRTPGERAVSAAGRALDSRMSRLLEEGRRYWLPRLRELRSLRAAGSLLPQGLAVHELL